MSAVCVFAIPSPIIFLQLFILFQRFFQNSLLVTSRNLLCRPCHELLIFYASQKHIPRRLWCHIFWDSSHLQQRWNVAIFFPNRPCIKWRLDFFTQSIWSAKKCSHKCSIFLSDVLFSSELDFAQIENAKKLLLHSSCSEDLIFDKWKSFAWTLREVIDRFRWMRTFISVRLRGWWSVIWSFIDSHEELQC